jgi:thioester reductase-like protein
MGGYPVDNLCYALVVNIIVHAAAMVDVVTHYAQFFAAAA